MGRVLWTCCKAGHPLNPSNCYWEYSTLYPYKRCKLCRSEERKRQYKRGRAKAQWLRQNYEIATWRTGLDAGLISPRPTQVMGLGSRCQPTTELR